MKRISLILTAMTAWIAVTAQTLNVQVGNVIYQISSDESGEMTFQNATSLTILGKTFLLKDIEQMYVDNTVVADSTVSVVYDGTMAKVYVAGNVAQYVTPTVSGAHVTLVQSDALPFEITYKLSGSSTDGEFAMYGSYKATVELNALTLTNPSGAAVNIQNGKRIDVTVKKDTENTLTDGANGEQKACFVSKGHTEFKGHGTLNIYANTAHGIKTSDYMTVKNCTINVKKAVKDGIHANEYFLMKNGTLNISGVGDDAIQTELDGTANTGETTDHEEEDTGNIYIEGGTLTLTTTDNGTKCMKADSLSTIRIDGGELTLNASGAIDTSDATDPSYVTAIKTGTFVQNAGTIGITVKGTAGRGIVADNLTTNGGTLTINNAATPGTISSDVKSAKGLKGLNVALNAGTITINMTGNAGKGIVAGNGIQSTSSSGGGGGWWFAPGGGGRPGGGGMGGGSTWTNITGSYTQGTSDGNGPTLVVTTTGSAYSDSSAKAIKAICAAFIYGGTTEVSTKTSGAEGLESKTSVNVEGGKHYFACYDDCINSAGKITFNGGVTVCFSNGNDAIDSNAGTTGAITIGNGAAFAYTSKGAPEEGFDCDNNSYIQITGTGIGISAGAAQGGGGGSSSGNTISNAAQGYAFVTSSISYRTGNYYTLCDASNNNLVTYSFNANVSSSLALFTAKGMVKNSTYYVKYSSTAPTDATTAWHGLYLGSSHKGTSQATSFTAK